MNFRMRTIALVLGTAALLPALGCAGAKPATTSTTGATFNYVPLNDDSCALAAGDTPAVAAGVKLASLSFTYTNAAAINLKLCDTCTDNKLLDLLKSVKGSVNIAGTDTDKPLADLVNDSLAYPFRELLVSWKDGDAAALEVVLSQGILRGNKDDRLYDVQPESLDKACAEFNNKISATQTTTTASDGSSSTVVTTAQPGDAPFGIDVPIVLPDLTDDPAEVAGALFAAPALKIHISKPEIAFTADGRGAGTGTLSGWVDPNDLQVFGADAAALAPYLDDASGQIRAVLSFTLAPATVNSGVDADAIRHAPSTDPEFASVDAPLVSGDILAARVYDAYYADSFNFDCSGSCKRLGIKPGPSSSSCSDVAQFRNVVLFSGSTASVSLGAMPDMAFVNDSLKAKTPIAWGLPSFGVTADTTPNVTYSMKPVVGTEADGVRSTLTVTRPWRSDFTLPVKPACVDLIAEAENKDKSLFSVIKLHYPTLTTLMPTLSELGMFAVSVVGTEGQFSSSARQIWFCQQFTAAQVCGKDPNKQLDAASGACVCKDGYALANGVCFSLATLGCPADVKSLVWDSVARTANCLCDVGSVFDVTSKTCVPPPCTEAHGNGSCSVGTTCRAATVSTEACDPIACYDKVGKCKGGFACQVLSSTTEQCNPIPCYNHGGQGACKVSETCSTSDGVNEVCTTKAPCSYNNGLGSCVAPATCAPSANNLSEVCTAPAPCSANSGKGKCTGTDDCQPDITGKLEVCMPMQLHTPHAQMSLADYNKMYDATVAGVWTAMGNSGSPVDDGNSFTSVGTILDGAAVLVPPPPPPTLAIDPVMINFPALNFQGGASTPMFWPAQPRAIGSDGNTVDVGMVIASMRSFRSIVFDLTASLSDVQADKLVTQLASATGLGRQLCWLASNPVVIWKFASDGKPYVAYALSSPRPCFDVIAVRLIPVVQAVPKANHTVSLILRGQPNIWIPFIGTATSASLPTQLDTRLLKF